MDTSKNGGSKLSFSLKKNKKGSLGPSTLKKPAAPLDGFESHHDKDESSDDIVGAGAIHPDLPKDPVVIPVQKDSRQSLQEQARKRRQQDQTTTEAQPQPETVSSQASTVPAKPSTDDQGGNHNDEDRQAIEALQAEAEGGTSRQETKASKMVIQGTKDTFQRGGEQEDTETQQYQNDVQDLAPEISVESQVYQQVPIAEFGAAMLRGMGWTGQVDKSDKDENLPRPSRLGLGATPKLLDAPTHGRRPRRQDQVQRDKKLREQQEDYDQQRHQQQKLDKQRTIQEGSIVRVIHHSNDQNNRAIIRKWQGVPGLNMAMVQFEGAEEPEKVKKGDLHLIDRSELHDRPFQEPAFSRKKEDSVRYVGEERQKRERDKTDDSRRDSSKDGSKSRRREDRHDRSDRKEYDRRERDEDRRRDRDRKRSHSSRDDRDKKRRKESSSRPSTWLIPNIRVRVVSSKLGKEYYKEKGVVIDTTVKGVATLKMANGQILQAPERYLETALPKVGGNACILSGKDRFAKGRLLERDSRANRGAVQIFEDMNIVSTSLDDMAEWCGPLDDDLME